MIKKKRLCLALITIVLGLCLTSCGEEGMEEANPATITSGVLSLSLGMSEEEVEEILGEGEEISVTYGEYLGLEEGFTAIVDDVEVTPEMKDEFFRSYRAYTDETASFLCLYEGTDLRFIFVVEETGEAPWCYDENISCGLSLEEVEEALGMELALYECTTFPTYFLEVEGVSSLAQVETTAVCYADAQGTMYTSDILMAEVDVAYLISLYFDGEGILLGYGMESFIRMS